MKERWPHFREQFLQTIRDFSDLHEISIWRICQVAGIPGTWLELVWKGAIAMSDDMVVKLSQALVDIQANLNAELASSRRAVTWHKVRDFIDTHGASVDAESADNAYLRRVFPGRRVHLRKKFIRDREAARRSRRHAENPQA